MNVSPIPTTRIDKDHPKDQIIRDLNSAIQTRRMTKISDEHAMVKSDSSSGSSKLDRSNAKGASTISTLEGYTQEEGIDYDEVFAPVSRIEVIRLFLAYSSFMGFIMYQMDVKSALLYGTIEEEVYVCQPPGFEDPQFPDKVYKIRLCSSEDRGDILLVQVYVDDIIFGSTKKSLCVEFEQILPKDSRMSSIRELTFFLGLRNYNKWRMESLLGQDKNVVLDNEKVDFITVKITSTQ
ncbi:putative ribonuclease H-like domain-containing protein [Tanacetum coccineum]